MTVLITGGAGFIGSHLADKLAAAGDRPVILDDLSTGRRENLQNALENKFVRLVVDSVLNRKALEPLIARSKIVYHLAAVVGVDRVCRNPARTLEVNINGTRNVIELCRRYGAKLVLASTSEVYGKNEEAPLFENSNTILGPTTVRRWSYAVSKLADEQLVLAGGGDPPYAILRYFNCYGPRLDPKGYAGVVSVFVDQALAGAPITVYGDGTQRRSYTYVDDTVNATAAAGAHRSNGIFNVGRPQETTVRDLAKLVRSHTGSSSKIKTGPFPKHWGRFEETRRRLPNIDRARKLLRFRPTVDLAQGVEKTIAWMIEEQAKTKERKAA